MGEAFEPFGDGFIVGAIAVVDDPGSGTLYVPSLAGIRSDPVLQGVGQRCFCFIVYENSL